MRMGTQITRTSNVVSGVDLVLTETTSCLRALLPTRDLSRFAAGATFCAEFIAAGATGAVTTPVTNAPPQAVKSCGTSPSRYSSACVCIPILPTPTVPVL